MREGLNDRHDGNTAGAGCREHHFGGFNAGQGAELVTVENYAVFKFAAVFIGNGKNFTVELLDQQRYHKVFTAVFFRHNDKNCRLFFTKSLGINLGIVAKDSFKLRIQKRIQARESCGHNACHGLFRCVERCAGKPFCLVIWREKLHELLELILVPIPARCEKLLNNFEHRHDVPFLRLAEFRNEENGRGDQTFCGIIEVAVLTEAACFHAGENNRLGDDFCVLFRLGFVLYFTRSGIQIHVLVDKMQKVVAV